MEVEEVEREEDREDRISEVSSASKVSAASITKLIDANILIWNMTKHKMTRSGQKSNL